jgi:hypothetical protein
MMSPQNFSDDWATHKDDLTVWRKFWALWELCRKWKWADWFYKQLDRVDREVVEPKAWSLFPGAGYMKLCLWIALLRSVHEGMTESLDSYEIPKSQRVHVSKVLPPIPQSIATFPVIKGSPFREFRNAIFHCQWAPTLAKFDLDEDTTRQIENLHKQIGDWLNTEFRTAFEAFKQKYNPPFYWVFGPDGQEFMPEIFY